MKNLSLCVYMEGGEESLKSCYVLLQTEPKLLLFGCMVFGFEFLFVCLVGWEFLFVLCFCFLLTNT